MSKLASARLIYILRYLKSGTICVGEVGDTVELGEGDLEGAVFYKPSKSWVSSTISANERRDTRDGARKLALDILGRTLKATKAKAKELEGMINLINRDEAWNEICEIAEKEGKMNLKKWKPKS